MSEVTRLPLVFDGLPDLLEGYKSWQDTLIGILRNVYAEVSSDITNVKISNEAPDDSQTDHLWGKLDNAGNFLGFAVFAQGGWRVISTPVAPGALHLITGDSDDPPDGFTVANAALVGPANLQTLQSGWNPADNIGPWNLFHVIYTGF